jgi:hypothetical protein
MTTLHSKAGLTRQSFIDTLYLMVQRTEHVLCVLHYMHRTCDDDCCFRFCVHIARCCAEVEQLLFYIYV